MTTMKIDPMDVAESGVGMATKRRQSGGGQMECEQNDELSKYAKKRRSAKNIWSRWKIVGVAALLAFATTIFLLFVFVDDVGEMVQKSTKLLKCYNKGGCSCCKNLKIRGGEKYVKFVEEANGNDGCTRLTIQCGKEQGTEAIIQWYQNDQDMGVSFMEREGQSNVRKTLECNANGQYELDENGHKAVITAVDCIVAIMHEEL